MTKITWPHRAKGAFAFGWDLDGDTIWYNKVKHFAGGSDWIRSRSVGMYGPRKGASRILDIMARYGLRATWFIPAVNVEQFPELACRIRDAGHEIAHHGYDHDSFYGHTVQEQLATIEKSQAIFQRVLGKPAVGFRPTGDLLPETEAILCQDPNTLYLSQDIGAETCQFKTVNGRKTTTVHVPCRQELDDYIQLVYNLYPPVPVGHPRIAPYATVLGGFLRELEGVMRFGNAVATAFHPQVSGTPGRAVLLEKLCEYLVSHPGIWCGTCAEIAAHYKAQEEVPNNDAK